MGAFLSCCVRSSAEDVEGVSQQVRPALGTLADPADERSFASILGEPGSSRDPAVRGSSPVPESPVPEPAAQEPAVQESPAQQSGYQQAPLPAYPAAQEQTSRPTSLYSVDEDEGSWLAPSETDPRWDDVQSHAQSEAPQSEAPQSEAPLSDAPSPDFESTHLQPPVLPPFYEMSSERPTMELDRGSALAALEDLQAATHSFLADAHITDESIQRKAADTGNATFAMWMALTNEYTAPRAYAYALDGQPVAMAVATEFLRPESLQVDGMISHPGARGAAPALLEEMMTSLGPQPEIRLSSLAGAAGVYRKLGFRPVDETRFPDDSLAHYDSLFLDRERAAEVQNTPELAQDLDAYTKMILRPDRSDLWAFSDGAWRYTGGGEKHLISSSRDAEPEASRSASPSQSHAGTGEPAEALEE